MKKLIVLSIIVIFFSCKNNSKKEESPITIMKEVVSQPKFEISDDIFRIVFEGIYEKDDLFYLFYSDKENKKTSSENVLIQKIKGSKDSQKIIFEFPEGVFPFSLRFDFSENREQTPIFFKKIRFIDRYNLVIIDNFNLGTYFDFNTYMSYSKSDSLILGKEIYLNNKKGYNPYFINNKLFSDVLNNFHKASVKKQHIDLIQDISNIDFEDGQYRVVLDVKFKNNDLVLLYFEEDTATPFNISNSVKKEVEGNGEFQKIIFTLPEGRYPSKISLDISNNIKQEKVTIKSLEFFEGKSSFLIPQENFSKYFHPNNYIDYDSTTNTYSYKVITESGIRKYNPYFVSSALLNEKLINF